MTKCSLSIVENTMLAVSKNIDKGAELVTLLFTNVYRIQFSNILWKVFVKSLEAAFSRNPDIK